MILYFLGTQTFSDFPYCSKRQCCSPSASGARRTGTRVGLLPSGYRWALTETGVSTSMKLGQLEVVAMAVKSDATPHYLALPDYKRLEHINQDLCILLLNFVGTVQDKLERRTKIPESRKITIYLRITNLRLG